MLAKAWIGYEKLRFSQSFDSVFDALPVGACSAVASERPTQVVSQKSSREIESALQE
jgi:hypothetical protein